MSLRDSLLRTFDGRPGEVVSGEKLAKRLGVSRTAVWKQIKALQAAGLPLESTGRAGYRLTAPMDNSLVCFRSDEPTVTHYFLNTPSTQTLAKAGAAAGLSEGHLWIAETQTKGRGRLERSWDSGYGGLWFSLLLRPKLPPRQVTPLTLVAGLALSQAVKEVCGVQPKLKWPNDLMLSWRGTWKKCAGILTEMSGQMDRTEWVVVGAGLNVSNTLSSDLSGKACSLLGVTGHVWPRARLLTVFIDNFREAYKQFGVEGFAPFRRAYWKNYFASDRPVRLKTAGGLVSGTACGVDAGGALMIKSRRKISVYSEGEIVL